VFVQRVFKHVLLGKRLTALSARGQEATDAITCHFRQSRKADTNGALFTFGRNDFTRSGKDVIATRKLKLQTNKTYMLRARGYALNPHTRAAYVGCAAKVGIAVEELIHEHINFSTGS
jgi:hypothetical protein